MKALNRTIAKVLAGLFLSSFALSAAAQDAPEASTTKCEFSTGADLVSSYVWRGVQYAGASVQPSVSMSAGGFTLGAWGSADFDGTALEMDLYTSYEFGFGLSLGLTDYYYPGTQFFDYEVDLDKGDVSSHWIEGNLGYSIKNLSLSANYMLLTNSADPDMYFELGYDFGKVSAFVGGGNGWHTADGDTDLEIVNIGLSTSKEIKFTESFTLPLTGSVILNPNSEQFYIVVAASL